MHGDEFKICSRDVTQISSPPTSAPPYLSNAPQSPNQASPDHSFSRRSGVGAWIGGGGGGAAFVESRRFAGHRQESAPTSIGVDEDLELLERYFQSQHDAEGYHARAW